MNNKTDQLLESAMKLLEIQQETIKQQKEEIDKLNAKIDRLNLEKDLSLPHIPTQPYPPISPNTIPTPIWNEPYFGPGITAANNVSAVNDNDQFQLDFENGLFETTVFPKHLKNMVVTTKGDGKVQYQLKEALENTKG